jgi:flagellar biosynthesis anti-sigma factor FlgM
MGISKIGSLFASNVDPLVRQQVTGKNGAPGQSTAAQSTTQSQQAKAPSTDAVVFSGAVRAAATSATQSNSTSDGSRTARIKDLKSQVESGSYKSDPEKVAVAVLKELA